MLSHYGLAVSTRRADSNPRTTMIIIRNGDTLRGPNVVFSGLAKSDNGNDKDSNGENSNNKSSINTNRINNNGSYYSWP